MKKLASWLRPWLRRAFRPALHRASGPLPLLRFAVPPLCRVELHRASNHLHPFRHAEQRRGFRSPTSKGSHAKLTAHHRGSKGTGDERVTIAWICCIFVGRALFIRDLSSCLSTLVTGFFNFRWAASRPSLPAPRIHGMFLRHSTTATCCYGSTCTHGPRRIFVF